MPVPNLSQVLLLLSATCAGPPAVLCTAMPAPAVLGRAGVVLQAALPACGPAGVGCEQEVGGKTVLGVLRLC
jgi:hypothetical protein